MTGGSESRSSSSSSDSSSSVVGLVVSVGVFAAAAGCVVTGWILNEKLASLRRVVENEKQKREAEVNKFKGAVFARDRKHIDCGPPIVYHPIGVVRSIYPARNFTPNQPGRAPSGRARIDFLTHQGTLEDLEKYSHVWILFHFHDNEFAASKSKVLPPRKHDRKKVGVFSCRTPTRPNPIGLSLVKLERVDLKRIQIHISGIDLLDGTPVLDIKPYLEQHDAPRGALRVADWVSISSDLTPDFESVEVLPDVVGKVAKMDFGLYEDAEGVIETLREVIRWDSRKRHIRQQHRDAGRGEWVFEMLNMDWILEYHYRPGFEGPPLVRCIDVFPAGQVNLDQVIITQ